MINQTQSEVLESFIGENGIYIDVIHDFAIDLGTKILYLERALELQSDSFHHFLDRLYEPGRLELIRALKAINDLYWDNEVCYGDYGVRKTLSHYFMALGDVDVIALQERIRNLIQSRIQTWCSGQEHIVCAQKKAREQKELDVILNMSWYEELKISLQDTAEQIQEPRVFLANNQFLLGSWQNGNSTLRTYRNDRLYSHDFSRSFSQGSVDLQELVGTHWSLSISSQDGKINIYHILGNLVITLEQQIANTYGVAVLANGYLIVSSNERQEPIRVYEPHTGELVRCFGRDVGASQYLKELGRNYVALGGVDKDSPLRIYNFETGSLIGQFSAGDDLGCYEAFIDRLKQVLHPTFFIESPPVLAALEEEQARRESALYSFTEESLESERSLSLYQSSLMPERNARVYSVSSEDSLEPQEPIAREAQESSCVFLECHLTNPSIRCVQRTTFFCRQAEHFERHFICCHPNVF